VNPKFRTAKFGLEKLQTSFYDKVYFDILNRATGNSLFEDAKFPPAKEKIPENSRSVNYLILHTPVPNSAAVIGAITTIGHFA